jgi:XTP/dITP diphosphohydrolase
MGQKIIFATNNQFKFKEVNSILSTKFSLISLLDLDFNDELPEIYNSIKANAEGKALYIYKKFNMDCFADDTGLEIEALKGEPGVYSARYAGDNCNFEANIEKVLKNLAGITNRKAKFTTVISLVEKGDITNFEGVIHGAITIEKRGKHGFGYDPIFEPDGYSLTFAEMKPEEKNKISHRARAINKLADYLNRKSE